MKQENTTKVKNPWIFEHVFSELNPRTIVCFPYAGGNTHSYSQWIQFIPQNYNLLAVQYPGRLGLMGMPLIREIQDLVKELPQKLSKYLLNEKVIFFGHSLGALVAFELTKHLEKEKKIVIDALCVSACASPDKVIKEQGIHQLSDEDFLQKISGYGGTPDELFQDKELMNFFLPALKADFCMYETYKFNPQERITCPLFIFGSANDPYAPLKDMDNWRLSTSYEHKLIPIEGDHFYINDKTSNFFEHFLECLTSILTNHKNFLGNKL